MSEGLNAKIRSDRKGNVKGNYILSLKTEMGITRRFMSVFSKTLFSKTHKNLEK